MSRTYRWNWDSLKKDRRDKKARWYVGKFCASIRMKPMSLDRHCGYLCSRSRTKTAIKGVFDEIKAQKVAYRQYHKKLMLQEYNEWLEFDNNYYYYEKLNENHFPLFQNKINSR